jgi:hypothetical protein
MSMAFTPRPRNPRFERGLEHVAGQARVFADEHRAALRRQHARGGAREVEREIHGHRVVAHLPAYTIGAEKSSRQLVILRLEWPTRS